MGAMDYLTDDEFRVLECLCEAFNKYSKLEVQHADDVQEFKSAIHAAQNIVMARPVFRHLDKVLT